MDYGNNVEKFVITVDVKDIANLFSVLAEAADEGHLVYPFDLTGGGTKAHRENA